VLLAALAACGYDEKRDNEENVSSDTITSVDSDETEMNWEQFVTYEPISKEAGEDLCEMENCVLILADFENIPGKQEDGLDGYTRTCLCVLKDARVFCYQFVYKYLYEEGHSDNYVYLGRVSSKTMHDILKCLEPGKIEVYQHFYSESSSFNNKIAPRGAWIDYYKRFQNWDQGYCIVSDQNANPHTMWQKYGSHMEEEQYIIDDEECVSILIWVIESDFYQKWEEYKDNISFR